DAYAGVTLVALVQVDDHRRQSLQRPRASQRPGVESAARNDLPGELERQRLGVGVVAADEGVFVRTAVRELPRGERGEAGDHGRPNELLDALGDRLGLGGP